VRVKRECRPPVPPREEHLSPGNPWVQLWPRGVWLCGMRGDWEGWEGWGVGGIGGVWEGVCLGGGLRGGWGGGVVSVGEVYLPPPGGAVLMLITRVKSIASVAIIYYGTEPFHFNENFG
jgi:hypothetical protein